MTYKSDPWPPPVNLRVATLATSFETPRSTYGPFTLDAYTLTWIVEGEGKTTLDDSVIQTRPGTVIVMRPGMVLRHDWGEVRSFQTFIVFHFDELPAAWPRPSTWPLERSLSPDEFFFALWRYVLAFEHARPQRSPTVTAGVDLLLRMFLTGDTNELATLSSPGLSEPVERALDYMSERLQSNPAAHLGLTDLARRAHVTPQHLCRLFRRELGESPMECVQLLRIERAASQLERTDLTIGQIADLHGYSSQFHFSRTFKQVYGVAPNGYRKAFRGGFATRPGGLLYRHHRLRRYLYERGPGRIIMMPQE